MKWYVDESLITQSLLSNFVTQQSTMYEFLSISLNFEIQLLSMNYFWRNYEKYGDVPNIVFPSGALIRENTLNVYYGGADTNVCLATCNVDELLDAMQPD